MKTDKGSPPLTRGILIVRASYPYTIRFTPAHAGNTPSLCLGLDGKKVHPRSRGEYKLNFIHYPVSEGSPPLTRGIRKKDLRFAIYERFTPAHAGNT